MRSNFKEIYVHVTSHDFCKINLIQINFYLKNEFASWCKMLFTSLPVSNIKLKPSPRVIIL